MNIRDSKRASIMKQIKKVVLDYNIDLGLIYSNTRETVSQKVYATWRAREQSGGRRIKR